MSVPVSAYPLPPGFAGQLTSFIYYSSYMPVPEVAIAATLGLLAGVCGRAYRTHTDKDLALYIILVARTGIGKDGIHEGIPKLIELGATPGADRFIRRESFVSGPALHKAVLKQPGFLNLQGEFGRKLKMMANPYNTPMQELRTVMTTAYAKRFMEGRTYSGGENSLPGIHWPALSFLGETTPVTFLQALTPDMMEDGFLSRFLIINHEGERPLPNYQPVTELDSDDCEHWQSMLRHVLPHQSVINTPPPTVVQFLHDDSHDRLARFELECRDWINASDDESERQVWNRAHLKALKIAGLLAAADNCYEPKIDLGHAVWAITAVRNDIQVFKARQQSGDIGNDDHSREAKLLSWMHDYLANGVSEGYKVPAGMKENAIITRKYLQHKCASCPAFRNHSRGATAALDMTLRSLVDSGYLTELDKPTTVTSYSFHGKCYRIVSLPGY